MRYLLNFLIALDQLLNTVIGGYPDESISARAYRQRNASAWGVAMRVIDFFLGKRHCFDAYLGEIARRQSPPEERL